MWKDYSSDYMKNNPSSSISIMMAAFLSALLLSLLCGLFYNAWKYDIERIELEEGGWQSRLVGEFDQEDIEVIKILQVLRRLWSMKRNLRTVKS